MSLSDARMHNFVDLTLDSSSEDEAVATFHIPPAKPRVPYLEARAGVSAARTPTRPYNVHAPLPMSSPKDANAVPLIFGKHDRDDTTQTAKGSQSLQPENMKENKARTMKDYVPVLTGAHSANDGFSGSDRAEKRRRTLGAAAEMTRTGLSKQLPATSRTNNHNSRLSLSTRNSDHAQRREPHLFKPQQPGQNVTNKATMPSVSYLNESLKAKGISMLAVDDESSQPRALRIGHLPESTESEGTCSAGEDMTLGDEIEESEQVTRPTRVLGAHKIASEERSQFDVSPLNRGGLVGLRDTASLEITDQLQDTQNDSMHIDLDKDIDDDKDSVMSDIPRIPSAGDLGTALLHPPIINLKATTPTASATQKPDKVTPRNSLQKFSEEEDHYLIYLKEVQRLSWKEITYQFGCVYQGRTYHHLQYRYSSCLNKRDRSKDPAQLKLPPNLTANETKDRDVEHTRSPGSSNANERKPRQHNPEVVHQRPKLHSSLARQTTETDDTSGTETSSRRQRTRRAPPVNYDVRRRFGRMKSFSDDSVMGEESVNDHRSVRTSTRPETPLAEQAIFGTNVSKHRAKKGEIASRSEDASIALRASGEQSSTTSERLPYLCASQRRALSNPSREWGWNEQSILNWQGAVLHVGFSPEEVRIVEDAIQKEVQNGNRSLRRQGYEQIFSSFKQLTEPKLLRLSHDIKHQLPSRDLDSIRAFLTDAQAGSSVNNPRIERLALSRRDSRFACFDKSSLTSMARHRELGVRRSRGWQSASKPITYHTRNQVMDTMGPLFAWTGASSDINALAWSPDGETFAAGAVAVIDHDSMQYNRPNNLLYGDITRGTIHELAAHIIDRPRTEKGANSTHAMYASQDPRLFTTVSALAFSPCGEMMYSAGYDKMVCAWTTASAGCQPAMVQALRHKAEVDLLAVSRHGILATASKRSYNAIKVIRIDGKDPSDFSVTRDNFNSEKASIRPDLNILPTTLRFDPSGGRALLAGFGANAREDQHLDNTGDLCLWDTEQGKQIPVHGSSRNVFDVAFNPDQRNMPWFAVGCVASGTVNKGTRSLLRLYDGVQHRKHTMLIEIECKALDLNDVVWCPHDEYLIAAGATNGCAYVYDLRRPDQVLRLLSHGQSLMPLQDDEPAEVTDTGVRFLSWGDNATRLYSGSSDGVVKVWDVTRSREDTFVKDLITLDSGVMAGEFSSDMSKLLIGEVNGSVNVLEVGRDDITIKGTERLSYIPWTWDTDFEPTWDNAPPVSDIGRASGRELIDSGRMQFAPMGGLPIRQAVQGPHYTGPFDPSVDAPFLREQALQFQLSLAAPPGPQCDIFRCKNHGVQVTSEEAGDSGRSTDRIPDELRRQWTSIDISKRTMVPGKTSCTLCGRAARPSASPDAADLANPLCERCSFACFRCGATNPLAPSTETLICDICAGVWEIGALGYECIAQPSVLRKRMDVPALDGWGREVQKEQVHDTKTSFGDEMNALTEHYFGLALDRPESPPL